MARRHRVLLGASLVSALAWQGVVLLMPIVLGWMVQHGIEDGERRAIWIGGGAIVALGIAEALCDALRHRTENAGAAQVAASLREEVVTAALTLDDRARASMPPGEVIARVTSDADAISDLFDSIGYTVAYILMVPTVLGILAYIDVMLASAVLGTSAAGAIAFWWASRAWEQRSALAQEAVGMMVTRAQETISGFKTLRGLGAEEATLARFDRASVAARDTSLSAANLWIAFEPFMDALSVLPVVIVLGAAGTQVADGELGVGTAITAIGLAVFLVTPVRVLGSAVIGLQQGLASARRVDDVLRGRIADSRPGRVGATHPPSIELRGAVCAHPGWPRMPMFAAIDLRLDPGDVLLIRGPVGAGKSLLLRAIAGREPLLDGEVRLGGVSLEHLARDEVRRRVLLLEQSPFIFEGTLADNLRIAGSADAATMLAAAAVADVSEFAGAGAAGLDTEAGERGVRLSGGQRQRLALARAVIARPEVLLLDGATSALEPAREIAALRRVIEHWRHGVIILVSPNPLAEPLATATLDLSPVPIEARR